MSLFGFSVNAPGAAAGPSQPPAKAPSRTFWGDVGKAMRDSLAAQYNWETGGPLNMANDVTAAGKAIGGVIDAGGAFAGRHLYDLNPRAYSDGLWNAARLATTIGPNPDRPDFLNIPGSVVQIPWKSPLQDMPAPMQTREDAETQGEIAANIASLLTPAGPEEAAADGARFVPRLAEFAGDAARTMLRPVNNAVGEAARAVTYKPLHFLDPQGEADRLLFGAALKDTQGAPEALSAAAKDWRRTGASHPSLMDTATTLPNGGQTLMDLTRAAASKGGGAGKAALTHQRNVAGAFPGKVQDLTKGLTPGDPHPAGDVLSALQAGEGPQAAIDSLNAGLSADLNAPDEVLAKMSDKTYGGIGLRHNLYNRFNASTSIDPDLLRQITNGDKTPALLNGVYGPDATANYQAGLANAQQRLTNANSIASVVPQAAQDVGSSAASALNGLPTTPAGSVLFAAQKAAKAMGLNPEEAQAVVNRATTAFDPDWLAAQAQARAVALPASMVPAGLGAGVAPNAASALLPSGVPDTDAARNGPPRLDDGDPAGTAANLFAPAPMSAYARSVAALPCR